MNIPSIEQTTTTSGLLVSFKFDYNVIAIINNYILMVVAVRVGGEVSEHVGWQYI